MFNVYLRIFTLFFSALMFLVIIFFFFKLFQREYEVTPDEKRLGKAEDIFAKYLQPGVSLLILFDS